MSFTDTFFDWYSISRRDLAEFYKWFRCWNEFISSTAESILDINDWKRKKIKGIIFYKNNVLSVACKSEKYRPIVILQTTQHFNKILSRVYWNNNIVD